MTAEKVIAPLWLRLVMAAWLAAWVPLYWRSYGAQNFLWFCDVANFLLTAAVWSGSRLLFSSQAVGVLLVQVFWITDVVGRLLVGFHPIGGTEYMFDPAKPLALRLVSLFHVAILVLLVWGLRRWGYDRRGLAVQIAITVVVLPISWRFGPELNINWTWGAFGGVQQAVPPLLWLPILFAGYVGILYLPSHLAFRRWAGRA